MSRRTSTRRRITILQQRRILAGARLTALKGGSGDSGGTLGAHPLPPVHGGAHRRRGQVAARPWGSGGAAAEGWLRGGVCARCRDAPGVAHGATFRRAGESPHRRRAHNGMAAFGERRRKAKRRRQRLAGVWWRSSQEGRDSRGDAAVALGAMPSVVGLPKTTARASDAAATAHRGSGVAAALGNGAVASRAT